MLHRPQAWRYPGDKNYFISKQNNVRHKTKECRLDYGG